MWQKKSKDLLPMTGLFMPAGYINIINSINLNGFYKGSDVQAAIEYVRREERERAVKISRKYDVAGREVFAVLNEMQRVADAIQDVALVARPGEKLRAYLIQKNAANRLSGLLLWFINKLTEHSRNGLDIIPLDTPLMNELKGKYNQLAYLCGECQKENGDGGQRLYDYILQQGDWPTTLTNGLRFYVNLGGHPNSEVLQALYPLAYPIQLKIGNRWSDIAKTIWEEIELVPDDQRDRNQQIIYEDWHNKTHEKRKAQIKDMFRKSPDYGVDGV